MEIRKLAPHEEAPMDLLLLADPSQKLVEDYLQRGQCYVAAQDEQFVGVYVLISTRPDTIELVRAPGARKRRRGLSGRAGRPRGGSGASRSAPGGGSAR